MAKLGGMESNTFGDTKELIASIKEDMANLDLSAKLLAEIIALEGITKAQNLTKARLPSGGGSYLDSLQTETTVDGSKFVAKIFSDHQWAAAVEAGTKPHEIPKNASLSEKIAMDKAALDGNVMYRGTTESVWRKIKKSGGIAPLSYKEFKETIDSSFKHFGKDYKKEIKKKSGDLLRSYMSEMKDNEGPRSNVWATTEASGAMQYAKSGAPEKVRFALESVGVNLHTEANKKKLKQHQGAPVLLRIAIDKKMKEAGGANLEFSLKHGNENYPFPKGYKVPIENVKVMNPRLGIRNIVQGKSKGQEGERPGYGTKYDTNATYFPTQVNHPGARAFFIFRDTQEWINKYLDKFITEALTLSVVKKGR